VSHHQAAPDLARVFACFQFDQKSSTNTCCERKLMLPHIQGAPSASMSEPKAKAISDAFQLAKLSLSIFQPVFPFGLSV
jgi:hypothetical protein